MRSVLVIAMFALAACNEAATDDANITIDNQVNAAEVANADIEVLPPDETAVLNEADDAGSTLPSPPGTPESAMIPAQYRGRWGMNPADCDQARSDNKGMITIGERSVRFYETTGTLKEQRPAIATSFSGLFAFTGEGQSWERVLTLTRTGDTLNRADDDANYTYRRCT